MIRVTRLSAKTKRGSTAHKSFTAQIVTGGLVAALGLFILPGLLSFSPLVERAPEPEPQATLPIDRTPTTTPAVQTARWDRGRAVRLSRANGTVEELTMEEYLWGVVAAEMPATFELEALKAQAAAARTYTVSRQMNPTKHEDADLCDDPSCCQAYTEPGDAQSRWGLSAAMYTDRIQTAINETDGLGVMYNGQPIQAVFFSSAAGRTVDAVEVWGSAVDYLVGVESPEGTEVPNYRTDVVVSKEEFQSKLQSAVSDLKLPDDPAQWLGEVKRNSAGGVASCDIGSATLSGGQMRTLFGLRSTSFSLQYQGGQFVFSVTGHGHGVGMSQYGANAMAKDGATFQDILTWYYSGTQVDYLWEDGTEDANA